MAQYKDGSVTVAFGSVAVSGVGTAWVNAVKPGDMLLVLYPGGLTGPAAFVAAVTGNGTLTLEQPWPGDSIAAASYGIVRDFEPSTGAPLLARGDIGTDIVVNRAIARLSVQTAAAVGGMEAVTAATAQAALAGTRAGAAAASAVTAATEADDAASSAAQAAASVLGVQQPMVDMATAVAQMATIFTQKHAFL